jgi:hypothetical protein
MKRYLKSLAVLALVLPLAVILAACGGKDKSLEGTYSLESFTILSSTFQKSDFNAPEGTQDKEDPEYDYEKAIPTLKSESKINSMYGKLTAAQKTDLGGVEAEIKEMLKGMVLGFGEQFFAKDGLLVIESKDGDFYIDEDKITVSGTKITLPENSDGPKEMTWNKSKGTLTATMEEGGDMPFSMTIVAKRTGDVPAATTPEQK